MLYHLKRVFINSELNWRGWGGSCDLFQDIIPSCAWRGCGDMVKRQQWRWQWQWL